MGFLDVAFLPSRTSFCTAYIIICGLRSLVGVSKGIHPVDTFTQANHLFVSVEFFQSDYLACYCFNHKALV